MAGVDIGENARPAAVSGDAAEALVSACVLNIERHALHDGPGIRTLVFLMGCPLRCRWCSNPEAQSSGPILIYDEELCVACGRCVDECATGAIERTGNRVVTDRERCTNCGSCVSICPVQARSIAGKSMSAEEVFRVILRDEVFYRHSSGGVTVSGGEPLLHVEFLEQLFRCCHSRGIHCAVETCGHCAWEDLQRILPVTDLFLFDLKHLDSEAHERETGSGSARIIENLTRLGREANSVIVRMPVVPGFNDSDADLGLMVEFVRSLGTIREVHLLPYHSLGAGKYRKIGREYELSGLPQPDLARLRRFSETATTPDVVIRLEI